MYTIDGQIKKKKKKNFTEKTVKRIFIDNIDTEKSKRRRKNKEKKRSNAKL